MKITAEFNSNEELLNFISTFGTKTLAPITGTKSTVAAKVEATKKVDAPVKQKEPEKVDNIPKVDAELVGIDETPTETKDAENVKEEAPKDEQPKITKEMVRAVFTKLIKASKQKEAKELTKKYGASKLPELKEENYAAVYKEAEGLL
jgi:hypothetical protein